MKLIWNGLSLALGALGSLTLFFVLKAFYEEGEHQIGMALLAMLFLASAWKCFDKSRDMDDGGWK